MTKHRISENTRVETCHARARKARGLAMWVKFGLSCAVIAAIWQDRGLSPQGHDRMKQTVAMAQDWLEQSEGANAYLTAMSGFDGNGNDGGHTPLTQALLNIRQ